MAAIFYSFIFLPDLHVFFSTFVDIRSTVHLQRDFQDVRNQVL